MKQRRFTGVLILLFAVACASPSPNVGQGDSSTTRGTASRETVERQAESVNRIELSAVPRAPAQVVLTLSNRSASPVGYNLCSSSLQQRSGADWKTMPTDEVCTMELRELKAGESEMFVKTLPLNTRSGEYRYVTTVEGQQGRVVVASNLFPIR